MSWHCANCRRVCVGAWVDSGGPERFCSSQCSAYFYGTQKREAEAKRCPECGEPFTWDHPFECEKWQAAMAPIGRAMDAAQLDRKRNGPCDLSDCHVCSGAMRSRAGKGDES